jgi:hypothetical protein
MLEELGYSEGEGRPDCSLAAAEPGLEAKRGVGDGCEYGETKRVPVACLEGYVRWAIVARAKRTRRDQGEGYHVSYVVWKGDCPSSQVYPAI